MDNEDKIRLVHMLEAAQEAMRFVHNESRESLTGNRMLALALIKDVEIIGEAASKISKDFQNLHPEISWPVIIAMRNRLVHVYFQIDYNQVWDTTVKDLPVLIEILQKILANVEGESNE